jgi:hypothetical protein
MFLATRLPMPASIAKKLNNLVKPGLL